MSYQVSYPKKIGNKVSQKVYQIKNEENDDAKNGRISGRGERIRTFDPLVPNQVRYQAALLPEKGCYIHKILKNN